ncbi:MAG: 23S rRNA (adenine(2503)-C(2))-methyltransferase RlmN [Bacillota bacterium]
MKNDLRSMDLQEMEQLVTGYGFPRFRAKQLFAWIHEKQVENFDQITNLGKDILEMIKESTYIDKLALVKRQSAKDGTEKFLLSLSDNNYIECVLMKYRGSKSKQRNTLCISSQVGCAMGCGFCATGLGGFTRNLKTGEVLSQVYFANNFLLHEYPQGGQVGNIVFMGMGEPLLNLANVIKAIKLLNSPQGQNIGIRRIAISTCGIVPRIVELADMDLDIVLAVSLHAPTNELRSQIMPVNKQHDLQELKKACQYYIEKTGNRITFEYAVVDNFNDSKQHAVKLAQYLRGMLCHVNIIPVNPVNSSYNRPASQKVKFFLRILLENNIEASIREEKGVDIDAACGQLRGKVVE